MVAFSLAFFAGTADHHSEAIREARAAEGDVERIAKSAAERRHRAELIEALAEPAMYIDVQGKVEAANAPARKQFRIIGPDPMLTAVVRRPEVLGAVQLARIEGKAQRFEFVERDETDRYFFCVAAPLGDGVLVSMHDLTEVKRAEFAR